MRRCMIVSNVPKGKYEKGAVVRFRRGNRVLEGVVDEFYVGELDGMPYCIVRSDNTIYGVPEQDIVEEKTPGTRPAVGASSSEGNGTVQTPAPVPQKPLPAAPAMDKPAPPVKTGGTVGKPAAPPRENFKEFIARVNRIDARLQVVNVRDGRIVVKIPYLKDRADFDGVIAKLKAAGARFDPETKTWCIEVDSRSPSDFMPPSQGYYRGRPIYQKRRVENGP